VSRTYLPTLLKVLNFLCAYIAKHRDRIVEVIGAEHAAAVDAVVTACHILTDVILPLVNNGT
jgi:hypothetical protein